MRIVLYSTLTLRLTDCPSHSQEQEAFSSSAHHLTGLATMFLESCAENLDTLENYYWNQLPVPGTIIYRKEKTEGETTDAWYVMGSTCYGCIGIKVKPGGVKQDPFYDLTPQNKMRLDIIFIRDLGGWMTAIVQAECPMMTVGNAVTLKPKKRTTLVKAAAMECFPGMSVTHMKALLLMLDPAHKRPLPTLVHDVVSALLEK
eukprot:6476345-Amphidinium_carterae.1